MYEKCNFKDSKEQEVFDKCLSYYKMPPEQIGYLYNNKAGIISNEAIKVTATGFLNGLTINDVNDVAKNFSSFPNLNGNDFDKFKKEINSKIRNIIEADIGSMNSYDSGSSSSFRKAVVEYAETVFSRLDKKGAIDAATLLAEEEAKNAPMLGFDLPDTVDNAKNDKGTNINNDSRDTDDDHDIL